MNSSSKVIMAATMVMAVSLVMVLSLVLVLLAELYCSLLLRRRRHNSLTLPTTTITATTTTATSLNQTISATENTSPSSLNPLNTGVLQTPKTFISSLPISHDQIREIEAPIIVNDPNQEKPITTSIDNFVYISNPIYSNEATTTPFETPQSSPSRLETGDSSSSSSSGEEDNDITQDSTPTLSPMKNLPEKACSVSLKGSKSLGSESNSNGGSTSSSGSPYTSPSW